MLVVKGFQGAGCSGVLRVRGVEGAGCWVIRVFRVLDVQGVKGAGCSG